VGWPGAGGCWGDVAESQLVVGAPTGGCASIEGRLRLLSSNDPDTFGGSSSFSVVALVHRVLLARVVRHRP
jgi:hypothetical protein